MLYMYNCGVNKIEIKSNDDNEKKAKTWQGDLIVDYNPHSLQLFEKYSIPKSFSNFSTVYSWVSFRIVS